MKWLVSPFVWYWRMVVFVATPDYHGRDPLVYLRDGRYEDDFCPLCGRPKAECANWLDSVSRNSL